jgi:hypothetical protein
MLSNMSDQEQKLKLYIKPHVFHITAHLINDDLWTRPTVINYEWPPTVREKVGVDIWLEKES